MMNKDKELAILECNGDNINIIEVLDKVSWSRLEGIIGENIYSWIFQRTGFVGRKNIEILQKYIGINNRESLLNIEKGISINDTIWFNRVDKMVSWDEISPYRNPLSRAISNLALNCEYTGGDLRTPSPEFTTNGTYEKCCKRKNKKLVIIKSSGEKYSSITGNEASSEIIYNQMCEFLGIDEQDYVKYSLIEKINKNGYIVPYCQCSIFTNEKYGLLEFGHSKYKDMHIGLAIGLFDRTINRKRFRDMLIIDCITFNIDRHSGNYGFIFDNDIFELKAMAPIYDNNLCSLPRISFKKSEKEIGEEISKVYSRGTNTKFLELSKLAMYPEMLDKLKDRAGEFKLDVSRLGSINTFDEHRTDWLNKIFNIQMKRIIKYNT